MATNGEAAAANEPSGFSRRGREFISVGLYDCAVDTCAQAEDIIGWAVSLCLTRHSAEALTAMENFVLSVCMAFFDHYVNHEVTDADGNPVAGAGAGKNEKRGPQLAKSTVAAGKAMAAAAADSTQATFSARGALNGKQKLPGPAVVSWVLTNVATVINRAELMQWYLACVILEKEFEPPTNLWLIEFFGLRREYLAHLGGGGGGATPEQQAHQNGGKGGRAHTTAAPPAPALPLSKAEVENLLITQCDASQVVLVNMYVSYALRRFRVAIDSATAIIDTVNDGDVCVRFIRLVCALNIGMRQMAADDAFAIMKHTSPFVRSVGYSIGRYAIPLPEADDGIATDLAMEEAEYVYAVGEWCHALTLAHMGHLREALDVCVVATPHATQNNLGLWFSEVFFAAALGCGEHDALLDLVLQPEQQLYLALVPTLGGGFGIDGDISHLLNHPTIGVLLDPANVHAYSDARVLVVFHFLRARAFVTDGLLAEGWSEIQFAIEAIRDLIGGLDFLVTECAPHRVLLAAVTIGLAYLESLATDDDVDIDNPATLAQRLEEDRIADEIVRRCKEWTHVIRTQYPKMILGYAASSQVAVTARDPNAIERAEQVANLFPTSIHALNAMSLALHARHLENDAIANAQHALELFPHVPEVRATYAVVSNGKQPRHTYLYRAMLPLACAEGSKMGVMGRRTAVYFILAIQLAAYFAIILANLNAVIPFPAAMAQYARDVTLSSWIATYVTGGFVLYSCVATVVSRSLIADFFTQAHIENSRANRFVWTFRSIVVGNSAIALMEWFWTGHLFGLNSTWAIVVAGLQWLLFIPFTTRYFLLKCVDEPDVEIPQWMSLLFIDSATYIVGAVAHVFLLAIEPPMFFFYFGVMQTRNKRLNTRDVWKRLRYRREGQFTNEDLYKEHGVVQSNFFYLRFARGLFWKTHSDCGTRYAKRKQEEEDDARVFPMIALSEPPPLAPRMPPPFTGPSLRKEDNLAAIVSVKSLRVQHIANMRAAEEAEKTPGVAVPVTGGILAKRGSVSLAFASSAAFGSSAMSGSFAAESPPVNASLASVRSRAFGSFLQLSNSDAWGSFAPKNLPPRRKSIAPEDRGGAGAAGGFEMASVEVLSPTSASPRGAGFGAHHSPSGATSSKDDAAARRARLANFFKPSTNGGKSAAGDVFDMGSILQKLGAKNAAAAAAAATTTAAGATGGGGSRPSSSLAAPGGATAVDFSGGVERTGSPLIFTLRGRASSFGAVAPPDPLAASRGSFGGGSGRNTPTEVIKDLRERRASLFRASAASPNGMLAATASAATAASVARLGSTANGARRGSHLTIAGVEYANSSGSDDAPVKAKASPPPPPPPTNGGAIGRTTTMASTTTAITTTTTTTTTVATASLAAAPVTRGSSPNNLESSVHYAVAVPGVSPASSSSPGASSSAASPAPAMPRISPTAVAPAPAPRPGENPLIPGRRVSDASLLVGSDSESGLDAAAEGPTATRERLVQFYEHYAPEKVATVDLALRMYAGREGAMFRALERKYGPESAVPGSRAAVAFAAMQAAASNAPPSPLNVALGASVTLRAPLPVVSPVTNSPAGTLLVAPPAAKQSGGSLSPTNFTVAALPSALRTNTTNSPAPPGILAGRRTSAVPSPAGSDADAEEAELSMTARRRAARRSSSVSFGVLPLKDGVKPPSPVPVSVTAASPSSSFASMPASAMPATTTQTTTAAATAAVPLTAFTYVPAAAPAASGGKPAAAAALNPLSVASPITSGGSSARSSGRSTPNLPASPAPEPTLVKSVSFRGDAGGSLSRPQSFRRGSSATRSNVQSAEDEAAASAAEEAEATAAKAAVAALRQKRGEEAKFMQSTVRAAMEALNAPRPVPLTVASAAPVLTPEQQKAELLRKLMEERRRSDLTKQQLDAARQRAAAAEEEHNQKIAEGAKTGQGHLAVLARGAQGSLVAPAGSLNRKQSFAGKFVSADSSDSDDDSSIKKNPKESGILGRSRSNVGNLLQYGAPVRGGSIAGGNLSSGGSALSAFAAGSTHALRSASPMGHGNQHASPNGAAPPPLKAAVASAVLNPSDPKPVGGNFKLRKPLQEIIGQRAMLRFNNESMGADDLARMGPMRVQLENAKRQFITEVEKIGERIAVDVFEMKKQIQQLVEELVREGDSRGGNIEVVKCLTTRIVTIDWDVVAVTNGWLLGAARDGSPRFLEMFLGMPKLVEGLGDEQLCVVLLKSCLSNKDMRSRMCLAVARQASSIPAFSAFKSALAPLWQEMFESIASSQRRFLNEDQTGRPELLDVLTKLAVSKVVRISFVAEGKDKQTIFSRAARENDVPVMNLLIGRNAGIDVNRVQSDGTTALLQAVEARAVAAATFLLKMPECNVFIREPKNHLNALDIVTNSQKDPALVALLRQKVNSIPEAQRAVLEGGGKPNDPDFLKSIEELETKNKAAAKVALVDGTQMFRTFLVSSKPLWDHLTQLMGHTAPTEDDIRLLRDQQASLELTKKQMAQKIARLGERVSVDGAVRDDLIDKCVARLITETDRLGGSLELLKTVFKHVGNVDWAKVAGERRWLTRAAADGSITFVNALLGIPGMADALTSPDVADAFKAAATHRMMRIPTLLALMNNAHVLRLETRHESLAHFLGDVCAGIASAKKAIPREDRTGRIELLQKLVTHPALKISVETEAGDMQTIFSRAAKEGDAPLLAMLLSSVRDGLTVVRDVNRVQSDKLTALIQAVGGNHRAAVEVLLDSRAIAVRYAGPQGTALDMATQMNRDPLIIAMLQQRASRLVDPQTVSLATGAKSADSARTPRPEQGRRAA